MFDLMKTAQAVKDAAGSIAFADTKTKNAALLNIARELEARADYIIEQNEADIKNAKAKNISDAMCDRLRLTRERISAIAEGVVKVSELDDPIGEIINTKKRPNGLYIGKKRVPIGVVGIIYEARPNVTADAAALCLKASNAVILRGGSEAIMSNIAIVNIMRNAIKKAGLDENCICFVEDTSHETAQQMMKLNGYIDVLIPRGGAGLIRSVVNNATVPVIETGTGNCHIYIDEYADLKKATDITVNAKVSRPAVCNAAESLLLSRKIAKSYLPEIADKLIKCGVELRGCSECIKICPDMKAASEEDFYTEYNDYIMSVKIVDGVDGAIAHINKHNTKHSEAIVTENYTNAQKFLEYVDAAAVYVNASTRFTDGFEFGFGAEIGISTQKIHARGPMGLNELTTVKYVIYGDGQIRN